MNKNMIETFNWQVLANKCKIYLFTKEMKKRGGKKGNTTNMKRGTLLYHRMFSN